MNAENKHINAKTSAKTIMNAKNKLISETEPNVE